MMQCCTPELVYKAAGGRTLPAGRGIAAAVLDLFKSQEQIDNPTTFRHWDKRLATALEQPILNVLIREAKKTAKEQGAKYDSEAIAADLLALSRSRSIATAASVNSTTLERLQGQDSDPFSAQRAAEIAITEASWAAHAAQGVVLQKLGKTWTWKTEPNACPACRKLRNKRVKVGKSFGDVDHPPLHPNCKCTVEVS